MDIVLSIPVELLKLIFDILNNDNIINVISLAHVNKNLHKLISLYGKENSINRIPNCKYAAMTNQIEMLKWALNLSFPISYETCVIATKNSNLNMLKWLLGNKIEKSVLWSNSIINTAAGHGDMNIVKWILENISSTKLDSLREGDRLNGNLFNFAVRGGNLNLVIFLKEHKFSLFPLKRRVMYDAILGGHIHILEWLKTQNFKLYTNLYYIAMIHQDIRVLDWLKLNECPIETHKIPHWTIRKRIIETGNKQILQWANNNGFPWSVITMMDVASYGTLETAKWLSENGCYWDSNVCKTAAHYGKLEMLKWLRENGCPWDNYVIREARQCNHYDVVVWALKNGCPNDD